MNCKMLRIFLLALLVTVAATQQVGDDATEVQETGRTFAHHFLKRIGFLMIPIMYKLGMMTTLLITLTIMSTKGLAVGVLLLVLAVSQIIARGYNSPLTSPAPTQPAVYPVVYSQVAAKESVIPLIHKVAAPTIHAVPASVAYSGWHDRSGAAYNPYARQEPDDSEYTTTD